MTVPLVAELIIQTITLAFFWWRTLSIVVPGVNAIMCVTGYRKCASAYPGPGWSLNILAGQSALRARCWEFGCVRDGGAPSASRLPVGLSREDYFAWDGLQTRSHRSNSTQRHWLKDLGRSPARVNVCIWSATRLCTFANGAVWRID